MAENIEHLYGTDEVDNAFSSVLSGRPVLRKKCGCGNIITNEKFCPECGRKL